MENLCIDHHCFAPDLLGFGESDCPSTHHSITLQQETLSEYLRSLKLGKVYLVGHALGGWIATRYALTDPDSILGLVLIAPEGIDDPQLKQRWQKPSWLVGPKSFWVKGLQWILPIARSLGKAKWLETLLAERSHLLTFLPACQLLFLRRAREIQVESIQDQLPHLTIPTLLLTGPDPRPEIQILNRHYREKIPHLQEKTLPLPDSNPRTCPDAVAQAIRDLIQEIPHQHHQWLDRKKENPS